jgi:hypothetical protein
MRCGVVSGLALHVQQGLKLDPDAAASRCCAAGMVT